MAETTRQILPGCRLTTDGKVDGRTKEAALMRRIRGELTAHVGTPTATQRQLIERAATISLMLTRLDTDLAAGVPIDEERYLAWSNSLSRIMARLGPPAPPPVPSPQEYLAQLRSYASRHDGSEAA
jgi:hypothetical protein